MGFNIFKLRLSIKIMTLLGLECEESDQLPTKICGECRMSLETLHIFKCKSFESDSALRKLIETTEKSRAALPATTRAPAVVMIKHDVDDDDLFDIEEPNEESNEESPPLEEQLEELEEQHIVEWAEIDEYEEDESPQVSDSYPTTDEQGSSPSAKRMRFREPIIHTTVKRCEKKFAIIADTENAIDDEPEETKNVETPYSFPLRTASEVHKMEAWMNQSPLHFRKVVYQVILMK